MNIQRLLIVGCFISLLGCVNPIIGTDSDDQNGFGGSMTTYYPFTSSTGHDENEIHDDFWDCGTDYIIVKDPDGNVIVSVVKIPCDPLQDIYLGCPSPIK